jgi:hypothetical protein
VWKGRLTGVGHARNPNIVVGNIDQFIEDFANGTFELWVRRWIVVGFKFVVEITFATNRRSEELR